MRRQLGAAVVAFLAFTVLCGIVYPLVVTGVSQVAFPSRADGSLVHSGGGVAGSRLIGRLAEEPGDFHPRPSAAGDGYDAMSSSASNLGPTNPDLIDAVRERAAAYREENGLAPGTDVPVDAVTASGSGLDPHISPENARIQARRVARARDLPLETVLRLVDEHTDGRSLGFLGEPGVNVFELNRALDAQA
jgi:K+-transporting ATPase ATPase C chain